MKLPAPFAALLARLVPTTTRVIVTGRQQPPAIAHMVDVDDLHGILRSAEQGYCDRLFGLYRDILSSHAHTQAEFNKRKLAVLGDDFTLTSADPKDQAQEDHNRAVQDHLTDLPGWIDTMSHALDSTLYPISLFERWYAPSQKPGWRYEIAGLAKVPHIHLAWPYGEFSLRDTDPYGVFTGTYSRPDPRLHIAHKGNLLTSVPDWWGGPMRAVLFWWLFSACNRDWWIRFLDRNGSPFLKGKYPSGDDRSRWELEAAFGAATKLFGIVVSNEADVELMQVNTSQGGDAFEKFHNTANRELSKLIIGQTSSAEIQKSGWGNESQGAAQSAVRDDIRQWDAKCLAATIRTRIIAPLWKVNGWTLPMPRVSWGAVSYGDAELTGKVAQSLYQAGMSPTDEGMEVIARRVGYGLQRVAPSALGSLPTMLTGPHALSAADPAMPRPLSLLPSVARRDARLRQGRVAVEALVARSSPKLARIMRARAEDFAQAILSSHSPEDAASRVAVLAANYDPAEAGELIHHVLTSAAVNAAIASE